MSDQRSTTNGALSKKTRSKVVARSAETGRFAGMSRIPTVARREAAVREIVKRSR